MSALMMFENHGLRWASNLGKMKEIHLKSALNTGPCLHFPLSWCDQQLSEECVVLGETPRRRGPAEGGVPIITCVGSRGHTPRFLLQIRWSHPPLSTQESMSSTFSMGPEAVTPGRPTVLQPLLPSMPPSTTRALLQTPPADTAATCPVGCPLGHWQQGSHCTDHVLPLRLSQPSRRPLISDAAGRSARCVCPQTRAWLPLPHSCTGRTLQGLSCFLWELLFPGGARDIDLVSGPLLACSLSSRGSFRNAAVAVFSFSRKHRECFPHVKLTS